MKSVGLDELCPLRANTKYDCVHGIYKYTCRECYPSIVCEHDRRGKTSCKICIFVKKFVDFAYVVNAMREIREEEVIPKATLKEEFLGTAHKIKYRAYGLKDEVA